MQVKILKQWSIGDLENNLNNFIKLVKVIDIKFSVNNDYSYAMIIYEELR